MFSSSAIHLQVCWSAGQRSCGALAHRFRASASSGQRQSRQRRWCWLAGAEGASLGGRRLELSVVVWPGQTAGRAAVGSAQERSGSSASPNVGRVGVVAMHPKRLASLMVQAAGAVLLLSSGLPQRARQAEASRCTRAPGAHHLHRVRDMRGRWQGATSGWNRSPSGTEIHGTSPPPAIWSGRGADLGLKTA